MAWRARRHGVHRPRSRRSRDSVWHSDTGGGTSTGRTAPLSAMSHQAAKPLLFQIWSYAHFPLYLSVAVLGVGVEHVISLAPGAHLHREDAWILTGAATALMTALTIIGFTSDEAQMQRRSWGRLLVRLALCFAALPASLVATVILPCVLLIYLAVLCAVQIMLATGDVAGERDGESEESALVLDLQSR